MKYTANMSVITSNFIFPRPTNLFLQAVRAYAARKGTRERKLKKKVKKVVEEKPKFIPHNERNREAMLANRPILKFCDSAKRIPVDDVYITKYFRMPTYTFKEAVQNHRETHHPDMYNVPNAPLMARIELNMKAEKGNKLIDDFYRTVATCAKFDHGEERAIIAFSKSEEMQKKAQEKGAQVSGGVELIKQIQAGTLLLKDFQFIVAHPDIMPDLVPLRGLMKRRFPSTNLNTLGTNLGEITESFLYGISYKAKKDEYEKDFGLIEVKLGTLDMDLDGLEGNFSNLIVDINSMRPKREGDFISRCLLWSEPSPEKFRVEYETYLEERSSGDDEEEGTRIAL